MRKRLLLIISGLLFIFISGSSAHAVQNISASLRVDPSSFSGKCPALIKFTGKISVSFPGKVQYKFIRSDGATSPVRTLFFPLPGSQTVRTTWQVGRDYSGWQAIHVISPKKVHSNRTHFNVNCRAGHRRPDLGMYGFLKIGKNMREVKWNETITLTPADATLVSGGKGAFEIYYTFREYNDKYASGPFQNKIYFNDNLVSQQTDLSCGGKEIRDIHTQAYLGPENGRLQVKIDADNEVAESREDNNSEFFVNIRFKGFHQPVKKKPDLVIESIRLNKDCRVVVKVRNAGRGKVPNRVWTRHNSESCSVYLSINGKKWGGKTIWKLDPDRELQEPGGTAKYVSNLKVNKKAVVKAEIDLFNQVIESNEANNIKSERLRCRPGNGGSPPVSVKEDCISFNPDTIKVKRIKGDWKIVDGNQWLFSFGNKKDEAYQAMFIIKKHGFSKTCYVGRPNPSFTYLK